MLYLKQATASQSVLLGPFVDSTDGATAETGLTIANTDIRLSVNGGNMAAKNSGGGTHDENGWYAITLDATDTATVGRLQISCKMAGALAVWMECQVLEENVYDAIYGASAALGTDVASILTDTGTTLQGELDGIQTDTEDIQSRLPAALTSNGNMKCSLVEILTTALTETAGQIAAAFKKFFDVSTPTGTVNSLPDAAPDAAGGLPVSDAGGLDLDTLDSNVSAVLVDTAEIGTAGAGLTDLGGMSTGMKAEVNAEVKDVTDTDTHAEPGQGTPPATASLKDKIGYLYKNWRNKKEQTATEWSLYNDDGTTKGQKATVSDDGTTATKNEVSTGA